MTIGKDIKREREIWKEQKKDVTYVETPYVGDFAETKGGGIAEIVSVNRKSKTVRVRWDDGAIETHKISEIRVIKG